MKNLKVSVILKVIVALFPIYILLYFHLKSNRATKEFYKLEFTATVINSSDWQKRSTDFYLNNNVTLNFLNPVNDAIALGDSVYKAPNTYFYSVYRKDGNGLYKFIATYDYRKR